MAFKKLTLVQVLPYLLVAIGIIGYLSASIMLVDDIKILKDPSYVPSCNFNPIISCGTVMQSKQASLFGFPNVLIGFLSYTTVLVVGFAMLAGARFKRWFWLGLQGGLVFGLGLVLFLFYQTVYRINALCPFCITDWVITLTAFWYVLLYNIDQKHIKLPAGRATRIAAWARRHHFDILFTVFLVMFGFILKHFWYYYGHYFS